MFFKIICCLCICGTFASDLRNDPPQIQACDIVENVTEILCQSLNYSTSDFYEPQECYCNYTVEQGYQIQVLVEYLDLDGEAKDYVSIKTDNSTNEYKHIYYFKKPKVYIVLGNSISIVFYGKGTKGNHKGFSMNISRFGEIATTIEPPTTLILWPAPDESDSIYHTVFIADVTPKEFQRRMEEFRTTMANVTSLYCTKHNIPVNGSITEDNINIQLATQCPIKWPNSNNCVELRYAIPVFLKNDTYYEGYQLTSYHLKQMWNEYMMERLKYFNWTSYEVPDSNTSMYIWLAYIGGVLIVFLIFLLIIKKISFGCSDQVKRKYSDTEQIISTPNRVSDASLWPMSNQVVPPLFDNETIYSYYEPEMVVSKTTQINNQSSNMLDVEDSSDEEVLNINNISQRSSYSNPKFITIPDEHSKESAL